MARRKIGDSLVCIYYVGACWSFDECELFVLIVRHVESSSGLCCSWKHLSVDTRGRYPTRHTPLLSEMKIFNGDSLTLP